MYTRHAETVVRVRAAPEALFTHLDDHSRLSGHMNRSSWMVFGSRMELHLDAANGHEVGSVITLHGKVLGVTLRLEEAVVERLPPSRKAWETIGEPRLLVIGRYRMGFEIAPSAADSTLRVFIDYDLPGRGVPRALGRLFGGAYARWCTQQMARDAFASFRTADPRYPEPSAQQ